MRSADGLTAVLAFLASTKAVVAIPAPVRKAKTTLLVLHPTLFSFSTMFKILVDLLNSSGAKAVWLRVFLYKAQIWFRSFADLGSSFVRLSTDTAA